MQIGNFFWRKSQSFLFVVGFQVFNMFDGLWLDVHSEDLLVKTFVHTLKHRVVVGILALYREVLFNA